MRSADDRRECAVSSSSARCRSLTPRFRLAESPPSSGKRGTLRLCEGLGGGSARRRSYSERSTPDALSAGSVPSAAERQKPCRCCCPGGATDIALFSSGVGGCCASRSPAASVPPVPVPLALGRERRDRATSSSSLSGPNARNLRLRTAPASLPERCPLPMPNRPVCVLCGRQSSGSRST